MKNIGIKGIGHYLPKTVVTNKDLEEKLDTNDEWIKTRTGIEQRHIADDSETVAFMGGIAAESAIKNAGISADEVDLIIVASVTQEQRFPSVANQIQEKLGINNIPTYDLSAACSGFMYGMIQAYHFLLSDTYKNILVIGSEKLSSITDWNDRSTAVLFGDGAGAVVMGNVGEGKGVLSFEIGSDGSGGKHLYNDPYIIMNGREVFKFAVRQMPNSAEAVVKKAGLTPDDVDFLVPHQANIRIIDAARERLGLPEEKVSTTVKLHGNTSGASIPLALSHEITSGKINEGDIVVLVGFGGGLTWGAICLKWGK
jgi:3-oxoacyl-[acyl-carrier-protein] synthase-3